MDLRQAKPEPMAEILALTNMIEKVSKEKHDELVKKVESIKKVISEKLTMFTDWKEVLAANKELVVAKEINRESIERREEDLNKILEAVKRLNEIGEEEDNIDKVVEILEDVGIGINENTNCIEKVIDESIQKVKSSQECVERKFTDDERKAMVEAAIRKYEVLEQRMEEFNKEEKTIDTVLEMLEMVVEDGLDKEDVTKVMESSLNSEIVTLLFT